jgi:hypothetical protein
MSSIDMALLAFTTFNAIRVLAYFPKMAAILRDTNGATAISYLTWGLFAGSHLSTVGYALVVTRAHFPMSGRVIVLARVSSRRPPRGRW